MTNQQTIKLTPLGDRLLVLLDAKQAVSQGGIAIPDRAQDVPSWGSVIEAGPDAQHCMPADRVYVPTHLGTSYVSAGINLVIINEAKVLAREERSYHVTRENSGEIEQATAEVEEFKNEAGEIDGLRITQSDGKVTEHGNVKGLCDSRPASTRLTDSHKITHHPTDQTQ